MVTIFKATVILIISSISYGQPVGNFYYGDEQNGQNGKQAGDILQDRTVGDPELNQKRKTEEDERQAELIEHNRRNNEINKANAPERLFINPQLVSGLDPSYFQGESTTTTKEVIFKDLLTSVRENNFNRIEKFAKEYYLNKSSPEISFLLSRSLHKNGLINTTNISVTTPSLLEFASLKTKVGTVSGANVRILANKYIIDWINEQKLTLLNPANNVVFFDGMAILMRADASYSNGNNIAGNELIKISNALRQIALGYSDGAKESIAELINVFPEAAKLLGLLANKIYENPMQAIYLSQQLVQSIPSIGIAITNEILKKWDIIKSGNAYQRSKIIGKISTDILISIITAGSFSIATKGAIVVTNSAKSTILKSVKREVLEAVTQDTGKLIANGMLSEAAVTARGNAGKIFVKELDDLFPGINKDFTEIRAIDSNTANQLLAKLKLTNPPPFKENTTVYLSRISKNTPGFVRVYKEGNNHYGKFMVKKADIEGLNGKQLQKLLQTSYIPDKIANYNSNDARIMIGEIYNTVVPTGKKPIKQYFIYEDVDKNWFDEAYDSIFN